MAHRGHLFSHEGQGKTYSTFRPTYSKEIYDAIYSFAGDSNLQRALDVATGSGQAAAELAKRYSTVIAQDPSAEQLSAAQPQGANVTFEVATAEATGQPDASVDLVTVALALHWFDIPAFYREAARVLRPGGTLAVWAYGLNIFAGEPEASEALRKLFQDRLEGFWDPRMSVVMEDEYRGVEPGPPLFVDTQRQEFIMSKTVTITQVMGLIGSWSGYNTWRKAKVPGPDPILQFHGDLKDALGFTSHDDEYILEYPTFLILARKPNQ